MTQLTRILALLLLAVAVCVPALAKKQAGQTFTGTYDWSDGGSDELNAQFTPAGDNEWNVKFQFRWDGSRKTWQGTAEGSLEDGSQLTGTAKAGSRNWVFEAKIQDGVMRGAHTELKKGGKKYDTGTFEIRR